MDAKKILKAVKFAGEKHAFQRRKSHGAPTYLNHLFEVADFLIEVGGVEEEDWVIAALLHDTLEDTQTEPEEIEKLFGKEVLSLVQELTDDKNLPKEERKRLQVVHAPHKSKGAKQIKISDKISNVLSVIENPPVEWDLARRLDYILWSGKVVEGLRGHNPKLENLFDKLYRDGLTKLQGKQDVCPA